MRLLGNYQSKLQTFHYQELLRLAEQAVSLGEFGAGRLLDKEAIASLRKQSEAFDALPALQSGSRADADSLNFPISMLAARYEAISRERSDFLERMKKYLLVLEKDSSLVDFLLASANLNYWVAQQPRISTAIQFAWDFAAGRGPVDTSIPLVNPYNEVVLSSQMGEMMSATFQLQPLGGPLSSLGLLEGIAGPASVSSHRPINLAWSFQSSVDGESEEVSGQDWTRLSLLDPNTRITFGPPMVTQVLPADSSEWAKHFTITGKSSAGSLPVFIRVVFMPRRSVQTFVAQTNVPIRLTGAKLQPDDIYVMTDNHLWEQDLDYSLDIKSGRVTPLSAMNGKSVEVVFTELFPGYQCSINEGAWSQVVLLDPDRPYVDEEVSAPVTLDRSGAAPKFPITDELGNDLGLRLALIQLPEAEMLLKAETFGGSSYGAEATLEVEFDRPGHMNGVSLSPFSNYPGRLKSIRAEGLTTTTGDEIFRGDLLLDRPQTIRFTRRPVRRLFLQLYQENYTWKEHLVNPEGKIRKDALLDLQSVLPFSVRQADRVDPQRVSGAQYEFGLKDIRGEDWKSKVTAPLPGVHIAGPFLIEGTPEVIRLDYSAAPNQGTADISAWVLTRETSAQGVTGSIIEAQRANGSVWAYSAENENTRRVEFWVKFVVRNPLTVLSRYLLQVSHA